MKALFLSCLITLFIAGTFSCKKSKDYTCICRDTMTGDTLSKSVISATSSEDASDECDDKESPFAADRCEIQM